MSVNADIAKAMMSLHRNLLTIREFFAVAHPHLARHEQELLQPLLPLAPIFASMFEPATRARAGRQRAKRSNAGVPSAPGHAGQEDKAAVATDERVKVVRSRKGSTTYTVSLGADVDFKAVKRGVEFAATARFGTKPKLLGTAALMLVASSAEWYTSQLLHALVAAHPERLNSSDLTISFQKLVTFDSIETARAYLAESRIENVLRGPVEAWVEQLKKDAGIKATYVDEYRDTLVEAFTRRNLLVHNGGLVNSIYLARVAAQSRAGLKAGDELSVDAAYLENTVNVAESVFLLLGAELWKKVAPEDESRAGLLQKIGFHHLENERWRLAEHCYQFIVNDAKATDVDRLVARVNVWQARKWRGDADAVKKEVEATEFSALDPTFRLAHCALLDDHERCATLAKKLLAAKEISIDALRDWPLFREARKHASFANLIEKAQERSKARAAKRGGTGMFSVTVPKEFANDAQDEDILGAPIKGKTRAKAKPR